MQSQTGSKTSRNGTPGRGRAVVTKQPYTKGFNDEYQYGTFKTNKPGLSIQGSMSPARKIIVTPSTTKNASEYFQQRSKESSVPRSSYRGTIRNSQIQLNIDDKDADITNFEDLAKSSYSSRAKVKNTVKTSKGFSTNYDLETLRTDDKISSNGPDSARTPKTPRVKQFSELTTKTSTPKAGDYYSARAAIVKDKVYTEPDSAKRREPESAKAKQPVSARKRDSDVQAESRTTAAVSSNPRASALADSKWETLELPVTPEYVLQSFGSYLSPFEKQEIMEYPNIYYISDIYHKILARGLEEFDDERQDYLVVKNDHIRYRYEALEMMGKGSFGQVLKVYDHKMKGYAALKVIRSPKKFHFQAKIETKILKYMMDNNGADYNIIGVRDFFTFRNHACVVFDLMDSNLYDLLKKNKFRGFPASTVRKFAIQVLYALKFLRHHRIIHCDLKPENILLKQANRTGIKMIDFGSSCFEHEKLYTYIQSRFYRSPEVIMGLPYSTQIDMWSFGCLLCELYLGTPVFAGDSERDQLLSMFEVLGVPDRTLINTCPRKAKFFDENLAPLSVPNTKGKIRVPNSNPISSLVKAEDEKLLDLIRHCLEFDPKKRFTPDEALAHEWIVDGLPPQLQSQHLKFIRDTSSPTEAQPKSAYSVLKTKRNATQQDIYASIRTDESTTQGQSSLRRHASTEKAVPTLNVRAMHTQGEVDEKSLDMDDSSLSQRKLSIKKVSSLHSQREKQSLKTISKIAGEEPKSANYKSGSYSSYDRDGEMSSSRRGVNMQQAAKQNKPNSDFFNTSTNKIQTEETTPKGSMVAWDSSRKLYMEERGAKNTYDINKTKKASGYSHYFSPKAPHSVERVSQNHIGDASPVKNHLLPSLKSSASMKRLNY